MSRKRRRSSGQVAAANGERRWCGICRKKILGNRGLFHAHLRACKARKLREEREKTRTCEHCGHKCFGNAGAMSQHHERCPALLKCVPRKMFPSEELGEVSLPLSAWHYLAVCGLAAAWGFTMGRLFRVAVLEFLQRVLWGPENDYALLFEEWWGSRHSPSPRDTLSLAIEAHAAPRELNHAAFLTGVADMVAKRGWQAGVPEGLRNLNVNLTPRALDAVDGLLVLKVVASQADLLRTAVVEYVRKHASPHFVPSHGGFVPREVGGE